MTEAVQFYVGSLVRVRRLDDSRRDLLYSGFVGRIRRFRGEGAEAEAFVDTDGFKQTQAVTFRDWFRLDELEHPGLR